VGLIPRIVSTPVKWVSKKVLEHTLLRFPGGDPHSPIACTYCPEMCRFSCPTAVSSGNDAVTPCNKNSLLYKEERWPERSSGGGPLWPIYDCTGCGRCTVYCVYGMPVPDQLFEARKRYGWSRAWNVAAKLTAADDPIGDLADELGDSENAQKRLQEFSRLFSGQCLVEEPKALFFLKRNGRSAELSWKNIFDDSSADDALFGQQLRKHLQGRKWLVHESVWLSRRLLCAGSVNVLITRAQGKGVELVLPFQSGQDCIDCGGEGVFDRMFPDQASIMAREIWERDKHRADGVFCFSKRCAAHFKRVLGPEVPVVALPEMLYE
jgi:ferredoxin